MLCSFACETYVLLRCCLYLLIPPADERCARERLTRRFSSHNRPSVSGVVGFAFAHPLDEGLASSIDDALWDCNRLHIRYLPFLGPIQEYWQRSLTTCPPIYGIRRERPKDLSGLYFSWVYHATAFAIYRRNKTQARNMPFLERW